jgi:NAD(P)-dependent dehydrogenase (short-subunit alcohol dehydrogenase family)
MGKVAVVTGASSGVGRAVVLRLARDGWNVALVSRNREGMAETIGLTGEVGGRIVAFACDVADESAVAAMAKAATSELGNPDVLVNSAGTNVPRRKLEALSPADFRRILEVNLHGAFYCIHAFLPLMRRRGGTIVNIISDAGLTANSVSGAAYIASKFALTGLNHTINVEESRHGVRACAIMPGAINTPLLDRRPNPPPIEARERMLQPDDVAECVMLAINLPPRAIVEQLLVRPAS